MQGLGEVRSKVMICVWGTASFRQAMIPVPLSKAAIPIEGSNDAQPVQKQSLKSLTVT